MADEKELAAAYKAGWQRRDRTISILQPTNSRDEVYGQPRRSKATVRPTRYHHSLFINWLKESAK